MTLQNQKILGISVTTSSKHDILEEIRKYLEIRYKIQVTRYKKKIKPLVIFTPNPEIITYSGKNEEFRRIVNTAQINLPDGAGVVWAVKKLKKVNIAKIPGVDFMFELVNLAAERSLRIGLIGGKGGLAVDTLECLRKIHPKLAGWAMDGPQIQITNDKIQISNNQVEDITREIISEKTDILFVGFGFPKQEYFIDRIKYDKPLVLMAVGGSFDYISGRVPRAPLFIRNIGLEWLFRLLVQPWRLPRQLAGAEFFIRIFLTSPK